MSKATGRIVAHFTPLPKTHSDAVPEVLSANGRSTT
jgi:hypothetical protein